MEKFSLVIQWSEEDKGYIATIPELPGLSAFGSTRAEASQELEVAKEAYLEVFKEDGCELPEPETLNTFSGQTRLRLPRSLHASLSREAKRDGVSLNTYIVHLLSERNFGHRIEKRIELLEDVVQDFSNQGQGNYYVVHADYAQVGSNAVLSQVVHTETETDYQYQFYSIEMDKEKSIH